MPENKTFKIPADNLPFLKEQIEKLNKKVEKLEKKGYPAQPVRMDVGQAIIEKKVAVNPMTGEREERESIFFPVKVSGQPVKAGNYEFIATLQHEEGGTIVRAVAGAVEEGELRKYRDAAPTCNHCGWNRRRNDTFVVRDVETHEHKQVGRNCLADFFGFDPRNQASAAELYAAAFHAAGACEDEGFGGGMGGRVAYITIARYLPFVSMVIRTTGWLSRGKAWEQGDKEQATANIAWNAMCEADEKCRKGESLPAYLIPSEKDHEQAKQVVEQAAAHFDACNVEALSDYEHNLRVAMVGGVVDFRLAGIVASVINYIRREQEKKAERVDFSNSNFVGELKKRQVFTLKCLFVGGGGRPYAWTDGQGNSIKSWDVGFGPVEKGQTYTVKATPVKHSEYRGVKETMVNRIALHVEKVKAPRKPRAPKAAVNPENN